MSLEPLSYMSLNYEWSFFPKLCVIPRLQAVFHVEQQNTQKCIGGRASPARRIILKLTSYQ